MPLSVSFYVRVFWTGKNKKIFIYLVLFFKNIVIEYKSC